MADAPPRLGRSTAGGSPSGGDRHARPASAAGLQVVTPEQLALPHGTWEILQHPAFVHLHARHYGWRVLERDGVHIMGRHIPGLGLVRAKVYSPEAAAGAHWHRVLAHLRTGRVEVMTNVPAPAAVATPSSPPDLYSFVVDLRPGAERVFASFRPHTRKVIRRAERQGMAVRLARGDRDVEKFHEVLLHVTHGGVVYEAPELELLQATLRAGFGRLYLLEHQGRVVGGQYLLVNRCSHAHVLAYDRQACHGLSGYLLYWGAIQGEIEAGMPVLDLGAQSLSLQPGLTSAKRSFSPCLLPAYRYELAPSRWRASLDGAWCWIKERGTPAPSSPIAAALGGTAAGL